MGKTLETIFQTGANADDFEVIVVNDGTQDLSMEVVRQFADHPNLSILEQENQGVSVARMNGASVAKGEYIWFVDSDDWLVEDGVGTVLRLLEERPDAEVLMFPLMWVYDDPSKNHLDYSVDEILKLEGKKVLKERGLPVWASQRFVLRRKLFDNEWLFFPKGVNHQDEYFGPVLMWQTSRVYVMKDPVYLYRIWSGSAINSLSVRSSYNMITVHKCLMRFMEHSVAPEDRDWFRKYSCRCLELGYSRLSHLFGTRPFNRFIRTNRIYVCRQWLAANGDKPIKNKLGRLFYFGFPALRVFCLGKNA